MSEKRGLAVGGAVLVVLIGLLVIFMSRDGGAPAAPQDDVVAADPAAPAGEPPGFQQPADGQAEELLPAPGDGRPAPIDVGRAAADVRPEPPVVARGHVTWAGGPLPEDIDVMLYDADGTDLELTTAEADGSWELRWDEPLAQGWSVGTDSVLVTIKGTLYSLAPDNVDDLPLHLPGQPPVEVELALGLPPVLTGRVTDRATGAAIEAAEVMAVSAQRAWALDECFDFTEEDGSYLIELEDIPLRQLIVWCRADDWQAQMMGPMDVAFVATPGEGLRVDFALDRPVPWRGRITSALDGLPVADATITVGNDIEAFSDYFDFEISDEEGNFTLDLPDVPVPGAWLHAAAWDLAPVALRDVQPGQDLLIVLGAQITLSGLVTDREAQPVDSAAVQIFFDGETYWGDNGLYDEAFTEDAGTFEVALESAPGDAARLRIEAEGYAPFEVRLSDVAVAAGSGRMQVKLELTPLP